jgi:hypothetical protein
MVKNLSESTHYSPEGKKIQTNLFQKLKDAKDAYQNFTKQNKGKKYRLNEADSASSIEQLRKGIQLYKDEYAKEQESTKAELKKLENLKSKAALKGNTDIQNLSLKDLNTVKGKMKIEDAIRNSSLDSGTIAALYKGFGLDQVDRNLKTDYSAKEAKAAWKSDIMQDVGDYAHMAAMGALGIAGGGALSGAAGATGNALGKVLSNPYISAPLSAYGVYDAATNTIPEAYKDFSEGRYLEGLGNTALAGLDLMPGAVLGDFKRLGQAVNKGVKNTYKINPWAFKADPEAGYRMIGGKEGYLDAITSGQIRPTGAYEHAHFNIGQPLNPNRLSAEELIQAGSPSGYKGPYMAEMKQGTWQRMSDAFPNNPEMQEQLRLLGKDKDVWQHPLFGNIKVGDSRLKLYKEDWLKGYKEVPTELPGSPNASISDRLKQFFDRPPGPLMLGMPTGSSSNMVKKNIPYYEQLLNTYDSKVMSATNKKFYKDLIGTAKKQDGMLTEAQVRELDRLKTGNFDFGKRGFNKESLVQVEPKVPVEAPKSDFKSEIDWDKWNPEISKNPQLLQEYNAIEEAAKTNNTWMKNPDGSPFVLPDGKAGRHWTFTKGTPEQFVQTQSQNFKKAYPEGYDAWYTGRMQDPTEQFPLFAEIHPEGRSIFGGDYHVATRYASKKPEGYDTFQRLTTEFKPKEITKFTDADQTAKAHGLISPKSSNSFLFNARKQGWREIPVGFDTGITPMWEGQPVENFRERLKTTFKNPKTGIEEKGYKVKSDDIAEHLEKNNMDYATIEDVVDGSVADYVRIHNLKSGNYPKSLWGNNGMFDLSNPNIYKALIPTVGVTGLTGMMMNNSNGLPQQRKGGATNNYIELDIPKSKMQHYIDQGYIIEKV